VGGPHCVQWAWSGEVDPEADAMTERKQTEKKE
jgi:hypothetical protein